MELGKGFGHRSTESNVNYTHYSMTEQLFEKEQFDFTGSCLEPACGNFHMVEVLKERFKNLDYYDIAQEHIMWKADFYKESNKFNYIITNPPYGTEADKFVMKAKEVCSHKFAMLLRTNYLSGSARFKTGIYDGLKNIYIFTRMPDLRAPIRGDGKYPTAMIVYAWMVWEIGYSGKPVIDWIDNQKFVLKKKEK